MLMSSLLGRRVMQGISISVTNVLCRIVQPVKVKGRGFATLTSLRKKRFVGDYRQCPYCAALIRIQLPRRFMPEQITEAFAIEILRNTNNCQTGRVSLSIRAGSERLLCLNSTSRYTVTL